VIESTTEISSLEGTSPRETASTSAHRVPNTLIDDYGRERKNTYLCPDFIAGHSGGQIDTGTGFCSSTSVSLFPCIIPQMLHTHLRLNSILLRRTNGRSLGSCKQSSVFCFKTSASTGQKNTLSMLSSLCHMLYVPCSQFYLSHSYTHIPFVPTVTLTNYQCLSWIFLGPHPECHPLFMPFISLALPFRPDSQFLYRQLT